MVLSRGAEQFARCSTGWARFTGALTDTLLNLAGLVTGIAERVSMKLRDVNGTDIPGAIRLGCRTMGSAFDADDNDVPFCYAVVSPDPRLAFSSHYSEAHLPGRHLNALLNAQEASGIDLDEEVVGRIPVPRFPLTAAQWPCL